MDQHQRALWMPVLHASNPLWPDVTYPACVALYRYENVIRIYRLALNRRT